MLLENNPVGCSSGPEKSNFPDLKLSLELRNWSRPPVVFPTLLLFENVVPARTVLRWCSAAVEQLQVPKLKSPKVCDENFRPPILLPPSSLLPWMIVKVSLVPGDEDGGDNPTPVPVILMAVSRHDDAPAPGPGSSRYEHLLDILDELCFLTSMISSSS